MLSGSNQLQYNIYKNLTATNIWGSLFWSLPPTQLQLDVPLNSSGTGSNSRSFLTRIFAGQTGVSNGAYSSTFTGNDVRVTYAYHTTGTCSAIGSTNATNVPFTVSATVPPVCTTSATTLDFGTQGVLDNDVDTTSTVAVTCTNGASYSVGLNEGTTSGGTTTTRKMVGQTSSATINYEMFTDAARTDNWGNDSTSWATGTGTGSAQALTVYGRMPAQTTPKPDTYRDTVTVTVTY
jgi:spore coat protein U-like protein